MERWQNWVDQRVKKGSEEGINLFIYGDTEAEQGFELTTFRIQGGGAINYAIETDSMKLWHLSVTLRRGQTLDKDNLVRDVVTMGKNRGFQERTVVTQVEDKRWYMNMVCYMWLMYKMADIRVQFDVTGFNFVYTWGLKFLNSQLLSKERMLSRESWYFQGYTGCRCFHAKYLSRDLGLLCVRQGITDFSKIS